MKITVIFRSILLWLSFLLLLFIYGILFKRSFPPNWERLIFGISGTGFAILATWIILKFEKRSFKEIGLVWQRNTIPSFIKGFFIGGIVFALILFSLLAFTALEIERNKMPIDGWAIVGFLSIIPLALMEEIAFRAYPMYTINKAFGLRVTQIIVALAFALYHITVGWTVSSAFLGPAIWAYVFGLAAVWSGGIAVPTGIHVALNFLQDFTGTRGEINSFWILNYKAGIPENVMAKTDQVGLATQVIVFIVAVVLTEYFIRKKQVKSKIV